MRIFAVLSISIALLLAGAGAGSGAGPLDDAMKAFERKDYAGAYRLVKPLAEKGSPRAQNLLGYMYQAGQGVGRDYGEAMKWYRKAAEQGIPRAQNNLAIMYATGKGVAQDLFTAYIWFNIAASGFPASDPESRRQALENRDNVAYNLSIEQVEQAKKLSKEWRPKKEAAPRP